MFNSKVTAKSKGVRARYSPNKLTLRMDYGGVWTWLDLYEDRWRMGGYPGYHLFGRGNERRTIFGELRESASPGGSDEACRERFLKLLAALAERYCVRVHAYALMDNHYHAALQTPEANLSAAMQWFHGSYSAWHNAKPSRVGSLFQGPYRAIPVENGAHNIRGASRKTFVQQHGNWGCALFLWGVRRLCGLTLREAGRRVGGMHMTTQKALCF